MVPKTYALLERCVVDGIVRGEYNYNKHADTSIQLDNSFQEDLLNAIMLEISEWFTFSNDDLGVTDV